MSPLRDRALAVAGIAFGAMWLAAAAGKVASPLDAYEFTARIVPPGGGAKLALAAAVAGEAALGAAMALRAIRGFWASLAALGIATAALLVVRARAGALVPCGCFGPALGDTIDAALVRNGVLAGVLVALLLLQALGGRSGRPAEADCRRESATGP